jgi:YidC/Oxa1 family membrane protein insertase
MDMRRVFLYALLVFVAYSLWNAWQKDYVTVPHEVLSIQQETHKSSKSLLPSDLDDSDLVEEKNVQSKSVPTIKVKTDVLDLSIDLAQGNITQTKLLHYPISSEEKNQPFLLLYDNAKQRYVADSNLFTVKKHTIHPLDITYSSEKSDYQLLASQKELKVVLHGQRSDGLLVNKEFIFHPGSYAIDVRYIIQNNSSDTWAGHMNTQLVRRNPEEDKSNMFHVGSFTGASYSQPGEHKYKKLTFKDLEKNNLDIDTKGGWIAMQQHYFLTAWIPDNTAKNRLYSRVSDDNSFTIGAVSPAIVVAPKEVKTITTKLYLGPEITDTLKAIAPGLDLTVDYGWLWFLSSLLFSLLKSIYTVLGNWGWSIVAVTLLIKLAFYRLSATSYKSMANMRKLQPKLAGLRERYGDDKVKISQATMELYRQEKVNPLGGCLPIVVQIPVFIALYWVLLESVELRQAPFLGWITDLASSDPYHVLPIIMGATMLIQQKLNPAPPDPMQAKVMMFLPILFTGLFWNFPAGLVLYWVVNNSLSILQQWYITRKYDNNTKPTKPTKPKLKLVK